jgi:hypothetical protein
MMGHQEWVVISLKEKNKHYLEMGTEKLVSLWGAGKC